MATIKYKVKFLDFWHLSSGLSGGAKLDSLVVKDKNDLPYIPAKSLKGLLREKYVELYGCEEAYELFGFESNEQDECFDKEKENKPSKFYISNAILSQEEQDEIISNKLQDELYEIIAATKIDKNGIAEDNSLREIEVVIPLTLSGKILEVPDNTASKLLNALKSIKRMGLNRNRGLGRCLVDGEIK